MVRSNLHSLNYLWLCRSGLSEQQQQRNIPIQSNTTKWLVDDARTKERNGRYPGTFFDRKSSHTSATNLKTAADKV